MIYSTEFPDFEAATMPAIPSEWIDVSWRNDVCPSFSFFEGGTGDSNHTLARVWIDHADAASREFPGTPRYSITYEGGKPDCVDILATDDWAEVLEYVTARRDLAARYVAAIGYNPFLDDPTINPADVAATLASLPA